MRQGANGIGSHDSAMIQNFLELGRSLRSLVNRQVGFASRVCGIKPAEIKVEIETRYGGFVGESGWRN